MIRYLTAGESHGKGLTAIIEGIPAGISLDIDFINQTLAKRQGGYGRGGRMKIEQDTIELITGVRGGVTLGTPITLMVSNRDWANWEKIMDSTSAADLKQKQVTLPRPGHADLAGGIKYRQKDLRNILERASARETAIRVAIGAISQCVLNNFGITVMAHVLAIGAVNASVDYSKLNEKLYDTPLYCTDDMATQKMIAAIDEAKANGDTLGGIIEVVVTGVPVGLGSHVQYDRKLDGRLAQSLMSIQAIKGVEIGDGFRLAQTRGSQAHDEIYYDEVKGFYHKTNHAGGLEGGITNGETLLLRGAMKPIPTLYQPLNSVDFLSKEAGLASVERSDACAVPACAIVAANACAWTVLECFLEKFSGDHLDEVRDNYLSYQRYLNEVMKR